MIWSAFEFKALTTKYKNYKVSLFFRLSQTTEHVTFLLLYELWCLLSVMIQNIFKILKLLSMSVVQRTSMMVTSAMANKNK